MLNYYQQFILNMDRLSLLQAFVATAETGSFSKAAARLGISNRLTSKYVAALEDQLQVRLLQRTTRKVGLTPAGSDLLAQAPALLDEVEALFARVADDSRGFTGAIRVSAPVTFGEIYIKDMLARFMAPHPELSIDLRLSDSRADLALEGIDVAFRIGEMSDSALQARKIGDLGICMAASPAYLKARGMPATPEELPEHDCIVDSNRVPANRWMVRQDNALRPVMVNSRFTVNSARAAAALAAQGLGIANGPRFAFAASFVSGDLIPVLPDYTNLTLPFRAVFLDRRRISPKLRGLIEFAANDFRQHKIDLA